MTPDGTLLTRPAVMFKLFFGCGFRWGFGLGLTWADWAAAAVGVDGLIQWRRIAQRDLTTSNRAMLALNAAMGLRTHPSWRRRVAASRRTTKSVSSASPT